MAPGAASNGHAVRTRTSELLRIATAGSVDDGKSTLIGRLLHEFSVVIMTAILVSGFVSLTLTPMLCSRLLRAQHAKKRGRVYMSLERFFERLLRGYDVSLQLALRHRVMVMVVSAAILLITVWQFVVIPKGFLPAEDASQIFGFTEAIG